MAHDTHYNPYAPGEDKKLNADGDTSDAVTPGRPGSKWTIPVGIHGIELANGLVDFIETAFSGIVDGKRVGRLVVSTSADFVTNHLAAIISALDEIQDLLGAIRSQIALGRRDVPDLRDKLLAKLDDLLRGRFAGIIGEMDELKELASAIRSAIMAGNKTSIDIDIGILDALLALLNTINDTLRGKFAGVISVLDQIEDKGEGILSEIARFRKTLIDDLEPLAPKLDELFRGRFSALSSGIDTLEDYLSAINSQFVRLSTERTLQSIQQYASDISDTVGTHDSAVDVPAKGVTTGGYAADPSAPPAAVSAGDFARSWRGLRGEQIIDAAYDLPGEGAAPPQRVIHQFGYFGAEQNASATLKVGAGYCHGLWINVTVAATLLVRDSVADGAGVLLATLVLPVGNYGPEMLPHDFSFGTGLRVTLSAGTATFNGCGA